MTYHILNSIRACAALGVCALALAACDPAVGPAVTSQLPRPGMTLKIQEYKIDMFGKRTEQKPDTTWITVTTDTVFGGRSPIARMVRRVDTSRVSRGVTVHTHFLENGNIAVLMPFQHANLFSRNEPWPDRWVTFPIGVKDSKTTVAFDTAFTLNRIAYRFSERWTTRFLGSEMLDTSNVTNIATRGDLMTVKAQVVQSVDTLRGFRDSQGAPFPVPVETVHTIWFSPKLGSIVRWETIITQPGSGVGGRAGSGLGWTTIGYWQR